jgi:hypothetical protein
VRCWEKRGGRDANLLPVVVVMVMVMLGVIGIE